MFFSAQKQNFSTLSSDLRLNLLDMIYQNGGHIGGSLSSLDLMIAVYYSSLFSFPSDHFTLSAGHLAPALYAVLASKGFFPKSHLQTYSQFKSRLQGHISTNTPGVEYSSGSLGQGLSFAAGLALGDKKHFSICLTSDGEHQEGQIWEAAMFARKYHLGNLINIVDANGYQIDGATDDIMPLGNLAQKYISFGWSVTHVSGHNIKQVQKAFENSLGSRYPHCIIAQTTFGKGISFMEGNYQYHDIKHLPDKLYQQAQNELKK
ncbi:MAG: transketolase [Patescibacteria group bacterium]|jgi:transketolase